MKKTYYPGGVGGLKFCKLKLKQAWEKEGLIWIPNHDVDVSIRLLIIGHHGIAGHRVSKALSSMLGRKSGYISFKSIAANFVRTVFSVHKPRGGIIPRPWSTVLGHPKRNERLHWDYCFVGPSYNGEQGARIERCFNLILFLAYL